MVLLLEMSLVARLWGHQREALRPSHGSRWICGLKPRITCIPAVVAAVRACARQAGKQASTHPKYVASAVFCMLPESEQLCFAVGPSLPAHPARDSAARTVTTSAAAQAEPAQDAPPLWAQLHAGAQIWHAETAAALLDLLLLGEGRRTATS